MNLVLLNFNVLKMSISKIKSIKAREILDSRGNPTVEVKLETERGIFLGQVPSGASEGKYEALELRDGGKRFLGKGVLRAVRNVNEVLAPKLKGKNPTSQKEIDELMIELDGTEQKSNLGVNAILPVSIAVCRAGASAQKIPLYQYLSFLAHTSSSFRKEKKREKRISIPLACFNIINGGVHAGNDLDFQEFMICPQLKSFSENLRSAVEIYYTLKEILRRNFGNLAINVGDEGGFAPPLRFAEQALELIMEALKKANYKNSVRILVDSAASEFYQQGTYKMKRAVFTREGLLDFYLNLLKNYPIIALEDPFAQDDFEGWQKLNSKLKTQNSKFLVFGDDLLATNRERMKIAKEKNLCNGLILKIDQIGTISEALEAGKLAREFGWKIMVSHRSGETTDDFIADLAVGISADFIKSGAPVRGERVAKYNRLLEIEEELQR